MIRNIPFQPERGRFAALRHPVAILAFSLLAALVWALGCREPLPAPTASDFPPAGTPSGTEFLLGAMEEIDGLADFALRAVPARASAHDEIAAALPDAAGRRVLKASSADTTYIYGEVTPGGYGAVVTERHTYPKGLPLITVRKTFGTAAGHMVTETRRYTSSANFLADSAEQSTVTEVFGLSADTLVTHVERNGLIETYTFRLPVITRVTSPQDGSVRVTSRFADAGAVVSEVRDGGGSLVSHRRSSGASDGAILSYTLYPDSTWRNTRTIGQADGSVLRDVTSGP
jgi:hypothetical protein